MAEVDAVLKMPQGNLDSVMAEVDEVELKVQDSISISCTSANSPTKFRKIGGGLVLGLPTDLQKEFNTA